MSGEITLEDLLYQYLDDPNDPENNFQMALYYDNLGQTASAVCYYLRAAERAPTAVLKYECLLRASLCFNRQGSRNFTVKGLLQHAVSILPNRPEAYYLLSRHYEHSQNDGHWTNSYMMASIGEKVADFNSPPLRTWVDYPGYYGITFQKALSSWHCGLCEESRDLFKMMLRDRNVNDNFKNVVINNLKWMNVYHEIPFDTYNPEKYDKFKFKFPGLEDVKENFSEAYQDIFVLTMLKGKKNGTYLEIGAGSPFFGSNTVLLERFGWKGHGFDINPLAVDPDRKNPCVLKDALTVDYDELLSDMEYGEVIDYLQVDLEPAEITYSALDVIPWDKYKFRVITFEHDYYNDESKLIRDKSRAYLHSKGYELLVTNIAPDTLRVFEDWWVHPDHVDKDMIAKFKNTSDNIKKAEDLFIQSSNLIELATKLRTIFPKGKKSGKWYWQGSVPEIKAKLQRFFRKYPHISENEVIEATRNYVNSFSEMERDQNMSLLSFFISKDDRSILLEYCENKEDILKRKNRTLN
jgi:hypothetical protein